MTNDISSSPPTLSSDANHPQCIESPTPIRRGMQLAPALGNIPMLQPQRDRQDEWLRFSVGKGVCSSPDGQAPPLGTEPETIPELPKTASLPQRTKFVNQCMKNAGFNHPSDYITAVMTEDFQKNQAGKGSLECQRLKWHEWNAGFEDTMKRLDSFILSRRHAPSWKNKLESFNRATIGVAVNILNSEFVRFGTRSDPRRMDSVTREKDKSKTEPAYLQLEASEVTPEFLASNVIRDVTSQFKEVYAALMAYFERSYP